MRLMGLDVGSKTVGVAISDPLGITAQGIKIIRINEDKNNYGLDQIKELIDKYDVSTIVIGLPKNMNNTIGQRAQKSIFYGKLIKKNFNVSISFIDERLTTVQVNRMLIEEADISRKKRFKVVDQLAAVLILQNYLDLTFNKKER